MVAERLVEVVFTLVPNGQHGQDFIVLDFEQRDIACISKRNDEFAQEWIGVIGFAATKRHGFSELPGSFYRGARAKCGGKIMRREEIKQLLQVLLRGGCQAKLKAHPAPRCLARIASSAASDSSLLT